MLKQQIPVAIPSDMLKVVSRFCVVLFGQFQMVKDADDLLKLLLGGEGECDFPFTGIIARKFHRHAKSRCQVFLQNPVILGFQRFVADVLLVFILIVGLLHLFCPLLDLSHR